MLDGYQTWRRRSRAVKEAKLLLKEARRLLRKYGHRVNDARAGDVQQAIGNLAKATSARDFDALPGALNALDRKLDEELRFARKSTAREYVEAIAGAILIALFLRTFVVEAFKIPSGSMIPTLQVGDHIFVSKFVYGVRVPFTDYKVGMDYRRPERGEVIVFIYPKEPDKDFIKRIVGAPGDTVEVRDNALYVNGQAVERKRVEGDCRYMDFQEVTNRWEEMRCEAFSEKLGSSSYTTYYDLNGAVHSFPQVKVPNDAVFVMGDNRDNSHDSRYWGFVPLSFIKGRAMVIRWSAGEPEGWIRPQRLFSLVH